jgi:hypothetical protein
MHEHPRIDRLIEELLTGSGLPVDRRSEIAEELRGHLDQSIARACASGQSQEQAVESVLAEFGSPAVIRGQLQRQQRMADRRRALTELRRQIRLPLAMCGLFAIFSNALISRTDSITMRCLGGAAMFAILFTLMATFSYAAILFGYQARRLRPHQEYHFLRSCLRWMALVALGFAALVPMIFLELAACAAFLTKSPFADGAPQVLCWNFAIAWCEAPTRNFGLTALGILTFGLSIAFYERSRCVDEPGISAAG